MVEKSLFFKKGLGRSPLLPIPFSKFSFAIKLLDSARVCSPLKSVTFHLFFFFSKTKSHIPLRQTNKTPLRCRFLQFLRGCSLVAWPVTVSHPEA